MIQHDSLIIKTDEDHIVAPTLGLFDIGLTKINESIQPLDTLMSSTSMSNKVNYTLKSIWNNVVA